MAKRTRAPDGQAAPIPGESVSVPAASALPSDYLSLREIDAIVDPEQRRKAALDRLDRISDYALGRERSDKNGVVTSDPDCAAACKIDELAHRLLNIEAARPKPRAGDLDAFSTPTTLQNAEPRLAAVR